MNAIVCAIVRRAVAMLDKNPSLLKINATPIQITATNDIKFVSQPALLTDFALVDDEVVVVLIILSYVIRG